MLKSVICRSLKSSLIIGTLGLGLICFILDFGGCSPQQSDILLVAVSIPPQQEFVEQIAGDVPLQIMVLIPPGADPHTYELTPMQMQQLGKAKAYFELGSGLPFEQACVDKISQLNPQMNIYDCAQGIQLMLGHNHRDEGEEHHDGTGEHHEETEVFGFDPHIWSSPENVKIMVDNISRGLIAIDPQHEQVYAQNTPIYKQKLDELDTAIRKRFASITNRNFIIFHPSWGYFARDYSLNQIAIEVEGKEPHAADLRTLINTAAEKNLKTVFASPEFNPESAKMIAGEIKGQVEYIDPLAKNYVENMYLVAAKMAEAMK